jgi:hypothetical protein
VVHDGVQLLRLVEVLAGVSDLLDDPGEELLTVLPAVHVIQELADGRDPGGQLELKADVAEELDQLGAGAVKADGGREVPAGARAAGDSVGEGRNGLG